MSAEDNTIKFPVPSWVRERNRLGPRVAPDELTSRMLVFHQPFRTGIKGAEEAVYVDVMSDDDPDNGKASRKLCGMLLSVKDLRRIVALLDSELASDNH